MPVISLLTDFGLADPYVGIMKGVIHSICADARIIDLTHQIAPQDIHGAAYVLFSAYRYFPEKTVHVVVVDPGVGADRRIIAAESDRGVFLGPDNGVLDMVLAESPPDRIVEVDKPDIYIRPVSRTFHGRDIFAPVAAHLARGLGLEELGAALDIADLVRPDTELSCRIIEKDTVEGRIIWVDRFGNLISNIGESDLAAAFGEGAYEDMQIRVCIAESCIQGISRTYQSVPPGAPLALIGSSGKLEISVNKGDAAAYFSTERGARVIVVKSG